MLFTLLNLMPKPEQIFRNGVTPSLFLKWRFWDNAREVSLLKRLGKGHEENLFRENYPEVKRKQTASIKFVQGPREMNRGRLVQSYVFK